MHTGLCSRKITGLTVWDVSVQTCIFEEVHITLLVLSPARVQALKWRLWHWSINQTLPNKLLEQSDCSAIIKSNMMHSFCKSSFSELKHQPYFTFPFDAARDKKEKQGSSWGSFCFSSTGWHTACMQLKVNHRCGFTQCISRFSTQADVKCELRSCFQWSSFGSPSFKELMFVP